MREVVPSSMRAPPETVKPTTGRPSSVARSKVRQIFSPTTEPMEPIMKSAFMKKSAASWPPIVPRPQDHGVVLMALLASVRELLRVAGELEEVRGGKSGVPLLEAPRVKR